MNTGSGSDTGVAGHVLDKGHGFSFQISGVLFETLLGFRVCLGFRV